MKRTKQRITSLFLAFLLLFAALSLTACGGTDGVPTGMQLAADGSNGYRVCIPGTWTFVEEAHALTAFVSQVDKTGIVLTYRKNSGATPKALYEAEKPTLAESLTEFTEVTAAATAVDKNDAYYAVYTYKIGDTVYRAESVYTAHGDREYVLTFTAKDADFASYEDTLADIIENITLTTDRANVTNLYFEDENAPEGMRLASDLRVAMYRLYVPEGYIVPLATETTMAYVSEEDRSSVNLHAFVPTVTTVKDYWSSYREELSSLYGEFTVLEECETAKFGEYENLFRVTYTGKVNGVSYKVMQYFMFRDYYIYSFTYTARNEPDANGVTPYDKNLSDVQKIVEEFKFAY